MSRLVVCNARIEGTSFDSVLMEDGVITKLAGSRELSALPDAEVIDVHGAYVSPGFIDSHMHLLEYGQFLSQLNLFNVHSREALLARVEAAVKNETSEDSWIIGRGFNEEQFDVAELPSLEALNAVSGKHPVALTRACGHQMLVNSKAMAAAGIDGDTMIAGGTIDFQNGRLYENAINAVHDAEPKPDLNQVKEWLLKAMKQMNRYGVTACGSDDFMSTGADWKTVMDAYSQLSYQQRMTVRVSQQCEFESPESFASFLDEGYSTGIGDDFFVIGPLKLVCDGSLGAHTAAMSEPYRDKKDEKGILLYDDEEMLVLMKLAAQFNMPTICHAIGDRAVDQVLKNLKKVNLPGNPLGHGLVHCQIMRPDQIKQIQEMNLNCYIQSAFIEDDAPILESRVEKTRADTSYPYATLFHSVNTSNGSDAPVTEPDVMKGIQLAVTRKTMDGKSAMNPKECLTIDEALASYTSRGSKALQMDIGEIAVGKKGDLVVLETDPRTLGKTEIGQDKVLLTIMNGEVVYDANALER